MPDLLKIASLLQNGGSTNIELAYQLAKSQHLEEDCYYLLRFGDMLEYLRSFEHIDIISFNFLAPNLEALATEGTNLDPNFKRFLSQCNGMSLFWIDKRNKDYEGIKQHGYRHFDGAIDIPAILEPHCMDKIQIGDKADNRIPFMGKMLDFNELPPSFDMISTYYDMLLHCEDYDLGKGYLLMGIDNRASYDQSLRIDVPSYIDLVLHSAGAVWARPHFLSKIKGYLLPVLHIQHNWFEQFPRPDFSQYPPVFHIPKSNSLHRYFPLKRL